MRVIKQEGNPAILCNADLDGDGREEIIVVNTRNSRLDIYHWMPGNQRDEPDPRDNNYPNELPTAPELKLEELQLEHLPIDVVVRDLEEDGRPELIILAAPPNKVIVYGRDNRDGWQPRRSHDLLAGEIARHSRPMLIRQTGPRESELLISLTDGVQRLKLDSGGRAEWLTPREHRGRINWWLSDLDGDGDQDLIEQSPNAAESVRWFECSNNGQLLPAHVLFDRAISDAALFQPDQGAAHLLLLDNATQGLMRRYQLAAGDPNPLGNRQALPIDGGVKAVWCGLQLGNQRALVVADRSRPRLVMNVLGKEGWQPQRAFPAVSDLRAIAAPQGAPGTLLLWAKDAGDLQICRWNNRRLTYPQPMPQSPDVEDRKILALASVGSTVWWVQKVGDDLDFYRWPAGKDEPVLVRFDGIGKKADKVMWLGGHRLLVQTTHARNAKLAVEDDGQTHQTEPAHLKQTNLAQYGLVTIDQTVRPVRLTDGVLQWLSDGLHAIDQTMLPHGQRLVGYVTLGQRRGWALQENGQYVHLLESSGSGLPRVTQSIKINGGLDLIDDPVLGHMLLDHHRVIRLSEGRSRTLQLVETIDKRTGHPSGAAEATIHRIGTAQITGNARDEVILFDDRRHQLTVLSDRDGELEPEISWPIFEDKRYPYGGDNRPRIAEPRAVIALNLDGDQRRDLVMACHDRLLVYLGQNKP